MKRLADVGFADGSIVEYRRVSHTFLMRVRGWDGAELTLKFVDVFAVMDRGTATREHENGEGFLISGLTDKATNRQEVNQLFGLDLWRDYGPEHRNPTGLRQYAFLDTFDEEPLLIIIARDGWVE